LNAIDESGSTPLIAAVKNSHVDVIHALLVKGMSLPFLCS